MTRMKLRVDSKFRRSFELPQISYFDKSSAVHFHSQEGGRETDKSRIRIEGDVSRSTSNNLNKVYETNSAMPSLYTTPRLARCTNHVYSLLNKIQSSFPPRRELMMMLEAIKHNSISSNSRAAARDGLEPRETTLSD